MRHLGVDPSVYNMKDLFFFYKLIIPIVDLPENAMAEEEIMSRRPS